LLITASGKNINDMKENLTLPSMFNANHTSKQALIIGAFDGIGQEFARMAAVNEKQLILVDSDDKNLSQSKAQLSSDFPDLPIQIVTEDLSGFDSADSIFESILFTKAFSDSFAGVDMLINILEYKTPVEEIDFLDEDQLGKYLDIITLEELNKLFAKEMLSSGRGEILNVLIGPQRMQENTSAYYKDCERMLMTFSKSLNSKLQARGVSVHALSYSGTGLVFLSPDATAAPGQAKGSYSMGYVQELLSTMS